MYEAPEVGTIDPDPQFSYSGSGSFQKYTVDRIRKCSAIYTGTPEAFRGISIQDPEAFKEISWTQMSSEIFSGSGTRNTLAEKQVPDGGHPPGCLARVAPTREGEQATGSTHL